MTFTSARASSKLVVATIFALLVSTMTLQSLPAEASVGGNGVCETANFAGGDGGSGNPYLIADEDDLKELGDCITQASTSGVHYKQIQDIDATGSGPWSPLGSGANKDFEGTYTAASTSRNLVFAYEVDLNSTTSDVRSGMFYGLSDGEVVGLSLSTSMVVEQAHPSGYGQARVGALAGNVDSSVIQDIDATVDLVVSSSSQIFLGGIAGEAVSSTMSEVTVMGSIKSFLSRTVNTFNNVGGLVGRAEGGVFSDIEVKQLDGHSKIYATSLLTKGKPFVGGLIGDTKETGQLDIRDARVSIPIIVDTGFYPEIGGLVGRTLVNTTVNRALVTATIMSNKSGDTSNTGGLIGLSDRSGVVTSIEIQNSQFSGHLINRVANGYSSVMGGIVGDLGEESRMIISNSSNVGAVTSPQSATTFYVGGILGELDNGSPVATVSNTLDSPLFSPNVRGNWKTRPGLSNLRSGTFGGKSGSVVYDSDSYLNPPLTDVINAGNLVAVGRSALSNSANIPFDSYSNVVSDNSVAWNQCAIPFLSWLGSEGCAPKVSGANVRNDGKEVELYFTQALRTQNLDLNSFQVVTERGSFGVTGPALVTYSGRAIAVSLSSTVLADEEVYVNFTSSPSIASLTDVQALSRGLVFINNTSTVTGPAVDGLASSNLTPTSVDLSFGCGGSCDPSASFDYVASITPAGGSATTQTDTTSGTATLSFNNLDPNVAHVISVTVTQGGLTSPAATLNVTTPKPIATISEIAVLDVSATLTVGCTNCGAAPDSFTVSATPVAGGPAITSNTNVISSLSPETTYSFSVVVAFAGTTSDVVLWQDNPVMTLPLVPVVSVVSPAALPLAGGSVTVTGSNFTTSSLLTLDGASLGFTIVSGTEIAFTAPSDTAGSYELAITNPVGTFTLSNAITYVSGPSLTTNSPVLATTNGGTIVTLTGTDLATTNQVNVGSTTVSFSVISNTVVRFTTDATTSGTVDIGVVTVGGAATISNAVEFTTSALVPVIGAIAPTSGTTAGGTTITVTGQYFSGSYSDSVSAAINGISGSSIVLIDDSTLTFVSPPGAAATGLDVTIATGGGLGTLAGAFTYTAPPSPSSTPGSAPPVVINTPTITEFSTREISASGAEVMATGLRLENVSVLTLGGITVTIVSNTSTSLTFTTGEMPVGVWDLRLVGSNGTLVFQQAIEVVEATSIVAESTGELLGYTWTFKFLGNSRSLHLAQREHLNSKLDEHSTAETIICWGYTTAENPNAWAIAHATQRAQAACDLASANNSEVKTVVRLRYGVSKNWAMRSALQFWR